MWNTRKKSIEALHTTLKKERDLIYEGFKISDKVANELNKASKDPRFARICGLVLVKGRYLCQGILDLMLDGLAQEAGALLRLVIECFELLEYFYQKPERIEEAIEGKLPSAGEIAKKIHGKYKDLREHLNIHASHLSISSDSMTHLIDWKKDKIKIKQPYSKKVLKKNLSTLFCFLFFLSETAAKCLDKCNSCPNTIIQKVNNWREKGKKIFDQP
jgi:hypothetical protein